MSFRGDRYRRVDSGVFGSTSEGTYALEGGTLRFRPETASADLIVAGEDLARRTEADLRTPRAWRVRWLDDGASEGTDWDGAVLTFRRTPE